jgi:hypothetical protein
MFFAFQQIPDDYDYFHLFHNLTLLGGEGMVKDGSVLVQN